MPLAWQGGGVMKTVKLTYDWWEAVLEVDESKATKAVMKEQLLFWLGGQDRINEADGDVEKAYLKMLAGRLILLSMEWNVEGVKDQIKESEGWVPIDGTYGVKLVSIDAWEFSEAEIFFDVMEASA